MRRTTIALACALLLAACTGSADAGDTAETTAPPPAARLVPQGENSTIVCLHTTHTGQRTGVAWVGVRALGGDVTLSGAALEASTGIEIVDALVADPVAGESTGGWVSDWPVRDRPDGRMLDWASRRPLAGATVPAGTAVVPVVAVRSTPGAHFGGVAITFERADGTTGTTVLQHDVTFADGTGCPEAPAP